MPIWGTRTIRKPILIRSPVILAAHVNVVLLIPFSILDRPTLRYRNGQTQASRVVYVYTSLSPNMMAPSRLIYRTNNTEHIIPRCIHSVMAQDIVFIMPSEWLAELSSDILGTSITASELVIALGNIIRGRAIPPIMP